MAYPLNIPEDQRAVDICPRRIPRQPRGTGRTHGFLPMCKLCCSVDTETELVHAAHATTYRRCVDLDACRKRRM